MDDEIQLISDGDGLAVIGEPGAVDRFLEAEGLPSRDLDLPRLGSALGRVGAVGELGAELYASSGRWVKLTKESAASVRKYGLRENAATGLKTGVVNSTKGRGKVGGFVEFARTPGAILTNPAALAGAAGMMTQLAMQQTLDEITDYLATIDQKVDDVLRAQKDAVLAKMIGVGFVVDDAMTTREHGGRVNEVTWSKVQDAPATIAETQAYALLRLDALAERVEAQGGIGDVSKVAREAEVAAREWLAVLARCFQLMDAIAVLELDRVLDVAPGDVDRHGQGLKAARHKRLTAISRSTERLMARLEAAASAGTTTGAVLLHPTKAPAAVRASNRVASDVLDLHALLGIESDRELLPAKSWTTAVSEVRGQVRDTGADGLVAVRRLGARAYDRARSAPDRLPVRIPTRRARRSGAGDDAGDGTP